MGNIKRIAYCLSLNRVRTCWQKWEGSLHHAGSEGSVRADQCRWAGGGCLRAPQNGSVRRRYVG
eukprot:8962649-Pyramimonas_sp.AAC.1